MSHVFSRQALEVLAEIDRRDTMSTETRLDTRLVGLAVDAYIGEDGQVVIHVDTPNVPENARGPICRIYLNDDTDVPLWKNTEEL